MDKQLAERLALELGYLDAKPVVKKLSDEIFFIL